MFRNKYFGLLLLLFLQFYCSNGDSTVTNVNEIEKEKVFTVDFETNGGKSISSFLVINGRSILLPTPEKFGNIFLGWTTNSLDSENNVSIDGSYNKDNYSTLYEPNVNFSVYSNLVFHAIWKPIPSYTNLNIKLNGGLIDFSNLKKELKFIILKLFVLNDIKWENQNDDLNLNFSVISQSLKVSSTWDLSSYTLIVTMNGYMQDVYPLTNTIIDNLNTNTPIKENYILTGWNTNESINGGDANLDYRSLNLSANWIYRYYEVCFIIDGGNINLPNTDNNCLNKDSNPIYSNNNNSDSKVSLKNKTFGETIISNPNKIGYDFINWEVIWASTQSKGWTYIFNNEKKTQEQALVYTNENIRKGTLYPETFIMPGKNLILKALWELKKYNLSLDLLGNGSNILNLSNQSYGKTLSFIPDREGYHFQEWVGQDNLSWNTVFVIPDRDLSLKAVWKPYYYTVVLSLNGGIGDTSGSNGGEVTIQNKTFGEIINYTPTRIGYELSNWEVLWTSLAWASNPNSNLLINGFSSSEVRPSYLLPTNFKMPSMSLGARALWKLKFYNINFELADNNIITLTNKTFGEIINFDYPNTYKEGYTFTNWASNELIFNTSFIMPDRDLNLVPVWQAIPYNIKFNANSGNLSVATLSNPNLIFLSDNLSSASLKNITFNDLINVQPYRNGFTFKGWASNGILIGKTFNMPSRNLELDAQWTASQYTITLNKNGGSGGNFTTIINTTFKEIVELPTLENLYLSGYKGAIGWSTSAYNKNKIYNTFEMPNNNVTLYVVWCTVGYVDCDNNGLIDIFTIEDLNSIRNSLNGKWFSVKGSSPITLGCPLGKCVGFEIVRNLDFNNDGGVVTRWSSNCKNNCTSGGWDPIGFDFNNGFNALLDGNGYTISNLYLNKNTGNKYVFLGLIGGINEKAVIKNINLKSAYINANFKNASNNYYIGTLIGSVTWGTVSNCTSSGLLDLDLQQQVVYTGGLIGGVSNAKLDNLNSSVSINYKIDNNGVIGGLIGTISGSEIKNSKSTGNIYSNSGSIYQSNKVGGLIGSTSIYTKILNSSSSSNIYAGPNRIYASSFYSSGGLVGHTIATLIKNSNASGEVNGYRNVGGLVGLQNYDTTISFSNARGNVFGSDMIGGLVGQISYKINDGEIIIENSYATGNVSGDISVGGLIGYNNDGIIRNSFAKGNVYLGIFCGGGFIGTANRAGSVYNNYANGNVISTSNVNYIQITDPGGFLGCNSGYNGNLLRNYATGNVSGKSGYVGGFIANYNNVFQISNNYWNNSAEQKIKDTGIISQSNKLAIGNIAQSNVSNYSVGNITNLISLSEAELKNAINITPNPSTGLGDCFQYNLISGQYFPKLYTWDSDNNTCTTTLLEGQ